jgi:hypothetical protein
MISSIGTPNPERMRDLLDWIDSVMRELAQVRKTTARKFNRPARRKTLA